MCHIAILIAICYLQAPLSLCPTVRFADLSSLTRDSMTQMTQSLGEASEAPALEDQDVSSPTPGLTEAECIIEDPGMDVHEGPSMSGSRHSFELEETDGISLSSNLLIDLTSDNPAIGTKHRLSESPCPPAPARPHKRQRIDISQLNY